MALVDRDPRLQASTLELQAARNEVDAAHTAPNPTLQANLGRGQSRADDNSRLEWSLALTMPLEWLAQRGARIDVEQAKVEVATGEALALRREVLQELRTLYWQLAFQQAHVESLQELERQTVTLVATVQRRVQSGQVRPVEATRIEIEQQRVSTELLVAETALRAKSAALAVWLTVPDTAPLLVDADLQTLPEPLPRDIALAKARTDHPSLIAARAQRQQLQSQLRAESALRFPAVALSGFTTSELDRRAYGMGVTVALPLFDWNSSRIEGARARLAAGQKRADAARLDLDRLVLQSQADCEASIISAARFRDAIMPRAAATASTVESTYRLGEATLLELIDARRTLLDARREYLQALATAHLDCSRLRSLLGEESP